MATIIPYTKVETFFQKNHAKNIVVAGGCFDLLHIGHISLLENAKAKGDFLVVLLESDEAIKKKKGIDRPIHNQNQRAEIVAALQAVDAVVLLPSTMTNNDYDLLLTKIKPKIIATTENDLYVAHKKRQAKMLGAKVIEVNKYNKSVSTTKLLAMLSEEL